jgi:hypothetical protein
MESVEEIMGLEPKPGRRFGGNDSRYIVPDVVVHKMGTEYVVVPKEIRSEGPVDTLVGITSTGDDPGNGQTSTAPYTSTTDHHFFSAPFQLTHDVVRSRTSEEMPPPWARLYDH